MKDTRFAVAIVIALCVHVLAIAAWRSSSVDAFVAPVFNVTRISLDKVSGDSHATASTQAAAKQKQSTVSMPTHPPGMTDTKTTSKAAVSFVQTDAPVDNGNPSATVASSTNESVAANDAAAQTGNDNTVALAELNRWWQKNPPAYPEALRRQRIAGRAVLTIRVNALGRLDEVVVTESSRNRLLDSEAVAAIEARAISLPVPEALRGETFAFELPVDWRLTQ